jgi:hypothetical protein
MGKTYFWGRWKNHVHGEMQDPFICTR